MNFIATTDLRNLTPDSLELEILDYIPEVDAKEILRHSVLNKHPQAIERLLRREDVQKILNEELYSINGTQYHDITLLHYLCIYAMRYPYRDIINGHGGNECNTIACLRVLLNHSTYETINRMSRKPFETTVLHLACRIFIDKKFAKMLVEFGAEVDILDYKKETPLEIYNHTITFEGSDMELYDLLKYGVYGSATKDARK